MLFTTDDSDCGKAYDRNHKLIHRDVKYKRGAGSSLKNVYRNGEK